MHRVMGKFSVCMLEWGFEQCRLSQFCIFLLHIARFLFLQIILNIGMDE